VTIGTRDGEQAPIGTRATSDEEDFERIFAQHERRIGQFLIQVVRSRALAEDLVQETFIAAYRNQEQLSSVDNVEAWLIGVARLRALAAHRREGRARRVAERLFRAPREHAPDPSEAVAVRDFIVRHLAADDRILVVLRYVHGFSAVELGGMTGRTPEAIRQQLSRARLRLLTALQRSEPANAEGGHNATRS
jgi:RNA polymerase sigma-70 factor (ECF subfamily)